MTAKPPHAAPALSSFRTWEPSAVSRLAAVQSATTAMGLPAAKVPENPLRVRAARPSKREASVR